MKKREPIDIILATLEVAAAVMLIRVVCLYVSVFGWVSPFSIY